MFRLLAIGVNGARWNRRSAQSGAENCGGINQQSSIENSKSRGILARRYKAETPRRSKRRQVRDASSRRERCGDGGRSSVRGRVGIFGEE